MGEGIDTESIRLMEIIVWPDDFSSIVIQLEMKRRFSRDLSWYD